jgi:hypothetical protein
MIRLNLLNRAAPADLSPTPEMDRLLGLWERYVGPVPYSAEGDVEDYFEQAVRLDAVLSQVPASEVYITVDGKKDQCNPEAREFTEEEILEAVRFGLQTTEDMMLNQEPVFHVERAADRYSSMKTFQNNAGRDIILCGFNVDGGGEELVDNILRLHADGIRRVFIKGVRAKSGMWDIELPEKVDSGSVEEFLSMEMEWSLIRKEGMKGAFILQQHIVMEYEYRVFVVNHVPVTGAGCVEEFTPLNNQQVFDQQHRKNRKAVSPVIVDESITNKLREFAETVAVQVADENVDLVNYVVDVAMNSEGEPIIVEFNSLLNSGLYASDQKKVVQALLSKTD